MKGFHPNGHLIGQIYKVGAPSIVVQAIGSLMTYGMNLILAAFGSAQTVFGIYFKLQSFVFMPVFGLNNGMVLSLPTIMAQSIRTGLLGRLSIVWLTVWVSCAWD